MKKDKNKKQKTQQQYRKNGIFMPTIGSLSRSAAHLLGVLTPLPSTQISSMTLSSMITAMTAMNPVPISEDAIPVGVDLWSRNALYYDPFAYYKAGIITSYHQFIIGNIGTGKSAFVKMFLAREYELDRLIYILDPKGEYKALAEALDIPSLQVAKKPINILGFPPKDFNQDISEIYNTLELLISPLVQPSTLTEAEKDILMAVSTWVAKQNRANCFSLKLVLDAFSRVDEWKDNLLVGVRQDLDQHSLRIQNHLKQYLGPGPLSNVFNSEEPAPKGDYLHVDVSGLYANRYAHVVFGALANYVFKQIRTIKGNKIFVLDESHMAWRDRTVAFSLTEIAKIARSFNCCLTLVTHRLSDFNALTKTEDYETAINLVRECPVRIFFRQDASQKEYLAKFFNLHVRQLNMLEKLGRGICLFSVENYLNSLIEVFLTEAEYLASITDPPAQPDASLLNELIKLYKLIRSTNTENSDDSSSEEDALPTIDKAELANLNNNNNKLMYNPISYLTNNNTNGIINNNDDNTADTGGDLKRLRG
jgi:hypothetical protein